MKVHASIATLLWRRAKGVKLFALFKKKPRAHETGDGRCAECPDHWPIEHQNCGGLFHANSYISPAETKRYVVCDKCGQGVELKMGGNIGSKRFPAEAARRFERMMLAKLTGEGVRTQNLERDSDDGTREQRS